MTRLIGQALKLAALGLSFLTSLALESSSQDELSHDA